MMIVESLVLWAAAGLLNTAITLDNPNKLIHLKREGEKKVFVKMIVNPVSKIKFEVDK